MKKLLATFLLCVGVASAQIPYNAYPPAGPLTGIEKVLINQGGSDGLYLTTTASIADLFGGSVTPAFNNVTSGTNTNSLVIGSGGTFTFSGSGSINANQVNGATVPASASLLSTNASSQFGSVALPLPYSYGGTNGTTAAAALNNLLPSQTGQTGDCLGTNGTTPSWVTCGSGGGGAFNSLTSGTNTSASMLVGTGATLGYTGSGTVNANSINGAGAPVSAALTATNVSGQFTALSLGANLVESGTVIGTSQAINAQTGTSYTIQASDAGKLVTFSNTAATAISLPQAGTTGFLSGFSIDVQNLGTGTVTITPTTSTVNGNTTLAVVQNTGCTISSDGINYQISACTAASGGGGSGAFGSITSGTNTTAAMLVGTGATLGPTGSGTLTANAITGTPNAAFGTLSASGTTTLDGVLSLYPGNGAGISAASWTTAGVGFVIPTVTYTDTTASGTVGVEAAYGIAAPTVAATNSGVSITSLATLYLAAPIGGTHVSSYYNLGLYTPAAVYIGGNVYSQTITVSGTSCNAPNTGSGIYSPSSNLGFCSHGTGVGSWNSGATGLVVSTPVYVGGTAFTVSGCGSAGSIVGTGTAGTFTVGTGANPCTFTITVNGATGLTSNHGWITNMDDVTAKLHCENATGGSATTAVAICNAAVTTGDTIAFSLQAY